MRLLFINLLICYAGRNCGKFVRQKLTEWINKVEESSPGKGKRIVAICVIVIISL